jgi:hypothetical protein
VTATSDRRRGPQVGIDVSGWGQRSAFGSTRGWPWWAAVLLALVLSMAGAFIDMHFSGSLGKVFQGAYFIGCVAAVCLVRRRNVFGPMVQPPLILAVTVPVAVLLTKGMPSGSGTTSKLITLGVPLVTGFPTMAITTVATVLIGGIRFLVQRKPAGAGLDEDDARGSSRGGRDDGRRRPDRPERAGPGDRADRGDRDRVNRSGRPDRADRDGFDRDGDADDRPGRSGQDRRGRPAGSGRPGQDREGRDDRSAAPRDRTRVQPPPGGRDETPDRGGRAASGRSGADRDRDRGQPARGSSQSRDRGQQRGARPARDDGRREPRRRDDDY